MKRSLVLPVALLLAAHAAEAQFRCDCTSIVDTCAAEVTVRGGSIAVTTDRPQCARVDYFVDGQPFVSLAVDGEARERWLAPSTEPRVIVQSCQVCRESTPGAATLMPRAASTPSDAGNGRALGPLIEVTPIYPQAALERRVRGHVDVEFTITPTGDVENARVTGAQPSGVFERAALAAVTRSRYPADAAREPVTQTRRIEFNPAAAPPAPALRMASAPPAGATGPRNQCVREDLVYNFGEMIEIGLLNACDEALLVFSCAEGTGRHSGRWACADSERQAAVLAPAGRSDPVISAEGYASVDNFFVSRAPNSQYWWVACRESDGDCRSGARQWIRALDGQPAAVDPQNRASVALARSY